MEHQWTYSGQVRHCAVCDVKETYWDDEEYPYNPCIAGALAAAEESGRDAGIAAGSWVIDGNTSAETARAILKGYDDGDPAVMDMESSPLSGEWADDPTTNDVLRNVGIDPEDDAADDVLTAYESAFSDGFWDEVTRAARMVAS